MSKKERGLGVVPGFSVFLLVLNFVKCPPLASPFSGSIAD